MHVVVGKPSVVRDDKRAVVTAPITIDGRTHELYYKISTPSVSDGVEPFVAAAFVPALTVASRFVVETPMSRKLRDNLQRITEMFVCWEPERFHNLQVDAPSTQRPTPSGRTTACFFSGGVDSFYTLLKHRDDISHVIFVTGFDVRLDDTLLQAKVIEAVRAAATELGKPLIEVETNLRECFDSYVSWADHYCGAAVASVALLLSPLFHTVYVAASASYKVLVPFGSHPLLDPLWRTEALQIIHDGCEASRFQKVCAIAQSSVVRKTLRVCWRNPGGLYNCGRCLKCLHTMALLRAADALHFVTTFDRRLSLRSVAWEFGAHVIKPNVPARNFVLSMEQAADYLAASRSDPKLLRALRQGLAAKYDRGIWALAKSARQRISTYVRSVRRRETEFYPAAQVAGGAESTVEKAT
ncbi:MAG: hypothetical protein M3T49_02315 [Candidatus Eremiobacteraeota bacterium]|nr:hypothetical protein [Candidatus Eremiobacteraeota bacterium]